MRDDQRDCTAGAAPSAFPCSEALPILTCGGEDCLASWKLDLKIELTQADIAWN